MQPSLPAATAAASSSPHRPHLTIRPASGWAALDLRELFQFRDLLLVLAARDVRLRYRQTVLGVLWVVLQPLIAALIFTFVFDHMAKMSSGGVPYFLFAFAGQLAFGAFASTLTKASGSLVGNAQLVSKVFFPRLILPLSTVFSTFVDFAVGFGLLTVFMAFFRTAPGWGIITMPLWLFLIVLMSVGLGLMAGALMVTYRDVAYILPVILNFLLFASPVGWMLSRIPEGYRTAYLLLNPLASLIAAFRWSVFGKGDVPWGFVAYAAAAALALFIAGALAFSARERGFADVI